MPPVGTSQQVSASQRPAGSFAHGNRTGDGEQCGQRFAGTEGVGREDRHAIDSGPVESGYVFGCMHIGCDDASGGLRRGIVSTARFSGWARANSRTVR